jgi:hypothetical protein
MKKNIEIKYRNGKYTMTKFPVSNFSASQARQLIEQIQEELREFGGNYEWEFVGDTFRGYSVVAHYNVTDLPSGKTTRGFFVESTGKTPNKALLNCNAVRTVLVNLGLMTYKLDI